MGKNPPEIVFTRGLLNSLYVACRLRITDEPGSHAVFQASDCYVHTHRQTGRQKDERFISYVCERERERESERESERETHTHTKKNVVFCSLNS